jgi:hypothetical protein
MSGACSTHGRDEKCIQNLVGKPEGKNSSKDLGVDGSTILEWILGKQGGKLWTGFIWLRIGTSVVLL